MNYFISDTHFFCSSQVGPESLDGRPFDTLESMHETMKSNWNTKVNNGGTVYILGDVGIGKEKLIEFVATLRGRKVLIKGNHDELRDYRYKQLFSEICDYKELSVSVGGHAYKLVLCHYPILMWNRQHKGSILLYGHLHNTVEQAYFQECLRNIKESNGKTLGPLAINVGCMMDYMGYCPRSIEEIYPTLPESVMKGS